MQKAKIIFPNIDDRPIRFGPTNISLKFSKKSNRPIDRSLELKATKEWEEIYKEMKEQGKLIFESQFYRLERIKKEKNRITLTLNFIPYSLIRGYRSLYKAGITTPTKIKLNFLAVCMVIRTSDNKFVLGKRSSKILNPGDVDFIGGGLNNELQVKNSSDLFLFAQKEMNEELSILPEEVKSNNLVGIINNASGGFMIVFDVRLNISSREFINNFQTRNQKQEVESIVLVNQTDFVIYTKQLEGFRNLIHYLIKIDD